MNSRISACSLPDKSFIQSSFTVIDYRDAYTAEFLFPADLSIDECVQAFFNSAPKWVTGLMNFRNKMVKSLGLKTSGIFDKEEQKANFKVEVGNGLGLFKILKKSPKEVMMGEDDKHLNFRVSLLLTKEDSFNNYRLTLSTAVKMNNLFGKMYFLPVKPIHKLIVPVMLRGIIRHLQKPEHKFIKSA
ncbi:MAG: hypothetical protein JWQ25_1128 [Daejeonella sp.]|nr:hypothetical protein [Daejeonella sp.]